MKVLVSQLRTHGDIIRTFPTIDAMIQHDPSIRVAATCYEGMEKTWSLHPSIESIITQPPLTPGAGSGQYIKITDFNPLEPAVAHAKQIAADIYLDFHGTVQSALFGCLAQIPIRFGRSHHTSKDGTHLFYTNHATITDYNINRMHRHWLLAKSIFPKLAPPPAASQPQTSQHLLIVPGSSQIGTLKRWPYEYYIALIERLLPVWKNKILVAFGPDELELYNAMKSKWPYGATAVFPDSFSNYVEKLLPACACVVGNDTAPLHLALWRRVPTFMILGPTSGTINGPWHLLNGRYVQGKQCIECNPWRIQCEKGHKCLNNISVEDVYGAIRSFITFCE